MAKMPEPLVLYKRLIKRAFIGALRTVYTEEYQDDPVLQNLAITGSWNIQQFTTPQIVIDYQGGEVKNMGVGHSEIWSTENGLERHLRRHWEGQITFQIYALSPTDRDIMFDSLTEILSFGKLQSLFANFFDYLYTHDFGIDAQIMLDEDTQRDRGDQTEQAWWQPEDVMIFSGGITMECHGHFASVVRSASEALGLIDKIIVYPYIFGYEDEPDPAPFTVEWIGTSNTEDFAYVKGEGALTASEA
jgi:hypothetical protein